MYLLLAQHNNPIPKYLLNKNESICLHKDLYAIVYIAS